MKGIQRISKVQIKPFAKSSQDQIWGLRKRVLPPLVVAICLLQGIFLHTFSNSQRQELEKKKQATAEQVQDLFHEKMQQDRLTMLAALEIIVRDPVLTRAFQNGDRTALRNRAKPIFDQFRQNNRITHWYFHQRDRVNFLRIHKEMFGDKINRITLKRAEQTQRPSAGLEQGILGGPVLRSVYPWRSHFPTSSDSDLFANPGQGELLGYVELGVEFQDIASQISEILDVELIVLIEKKFLDRAKWENQFARAGQPSMWEQFSTHVVVEQTLSQTPELIHQIIQDNQWENSSQLQFSENGKTQQMTVLPLVDLDSRVLGHIVVLKDISRNVNSAQQSILQTSIGVTFLGLGLIAFFALFLRRVEQTSVQQSADLIQAKLEKQYIQQSQAQLVQTEKMSSLGQLVAGIAHEINNPVSFIYGNLDPAQQYMNDLLRLVQLYRIHYPNPTTEIQTTIDEIDLEFLERDFPNLLASMKMGAERIESIVLSLRNFSRKDEAIFKSVDLHKGIESTLVILSHRLRAVGSRPEIQVIKHYGDLPLVECYASQLNQVMMNLLANGIDALEDAVEQGVLSTPTITITTQAQGDRVIISVADNGVGIPETIQPQLFDPFFTTKAVGRGTGMGLSISYQIIVENHGGQLECHSTVGKGTTMVVTIPVSQIAFTNKGELNLQY